MGIELEEALYDERLEEGIVANTGKKIINGVKQLGASLSKGHDERVAASNNAAAASDAKTADMQAQADQAKMDKVISGKSGISVAGQDKQTKAAVGAVNAIIKELEAKIAALSSPQAPASEQKPAEQQATPEGQVKEALEFVDILADRLREADAPDNKKAVAALTKFKDGLAKSLQSGVLSGKGLKTITDNLGKLLGDDQKAKALTDPLNQAYSAALETQYKQYQKKVADAQKPADPAQAQPATAVPAQAAQPTQATAQPAAPDTPKTTDQKPAEAPVDGQKPVEQKDAAGIQKAQDVIKKCSTALGQIGSSIDAIKSSAPSANFGQPSKDGFYAGVAGDTYIDQVKNIVAKVASDLNGYVMMKETEQKIAELDRLVEQLKSF